MIKHRREILVAAAVHLALAFIISFPLPGNFNSGIPYAHRVDPGWETVYMQQGDHLQFFYTLSLFGDYVKNGTSPFFADHYMFRTAETEKYFVTRELPLSIAHFALSPFGNIAAYNLLTVLSFVACGLGMFLLAGRYVKSFGGRLFASVIFSAFPFRLAQLYGGHPNGFLVFLIPFMVYGYERWFDEGKLKYLLLSAVCLLSMTMEELHLGYFSALFTAAFVPYKGISMLAGAASAEKYRKLKRFVKSSLGVLITWMVAGGYVAFIRNVIFKVADVGEGRELWEIGIYAPRLADFIRRGSMDAEKLIYPGIFALGAAVFAFVRKKRDIFPPSKKNCLWFYGFILVVTAILSLGPNLRGIPLYSFCYNYVPFFHYPRSTARIFVFTMLALSVLGAYGFETLRGMVKSKPLAKTLAPALILLALLDYQSFRSIGVSRLPAENSVYEYVKRQEEPGYLLEVPIWPGDSAWSSIYQYYNTIYRLPIVNGYSPFVSGAYIENIFWPLVSVNMGMLDSSQHRRLVELGVNYVVLHEEAYPYPVSPFPFRLALRNMKNSPFLEFIKNDGYLFLFRVKESPGAVEKPVSLPSKMGVFYEAEHMHSQMADVRFDGEASGGLARFAGSRGSGLEFVLFGPYRFFPPGEYRVVFRIKAEEARPEEIFAVLDVAGREGSKTFAEKTLKGSDATEGVYSDYEIVFSIDELEILEFRLRWFGNGKIWADYVYVTFAEEPDPVYYYKASEMFNSRGDAAYGLKDLHPPHNIAEGGSRRYGPGDYTASFRLKAGELVEDEIAVLRILQAGTGAAFAEKAVTGDYFDNALEYKAVEVPFSIDKKEVLRFEVFFTRKADIRLEDITIIPSEKEHPAARPPSGLEHGTARPGMLRFEYPNASFSGVHSPGVAAYPRGGLREGHSYIWEGFIEAEEGRHSAGVLAEGITKLYVGGEEMLRADSKRSLVYFSAEALLEEGRLPVTLKHVSSGSGGLFRLYWRGPSDDFPVPLPVGEGFFSYIPGDAPN